MEHIKHCPRCNSVIVKSQGAEVKIRSKMIIAKGGKTWAACVDCGFETEVPLLLDEPMVKSLKDAHQHTQRGVPLYVRDKKYLTRR